MLYNVYKELLPQLDGYLTEDGQIIWDRFKKLLASLRPVEFLLAQRQNPQLKFTATRKNPFPTNQASKVAKLELDEPIILPSSSSVYEDVSDDSFSEDDALLDLYEEISDEEIEFSDPEINFDDFKSKYYKDKQISE